MLIKRRLIQLKNLTWKEFSETKVFAGVDTWPYSPRGTLKQPQHDEPDPSESTGKIVEIQNQEFNEANRLVETFSEKQKSVIGWIFAAFIGVVGNLIVNLAFSSPSFTGNINLMFFFTIILAMLIILYLMFLPEASIIFKFVPRYKSFPGGYEKHISQANCQKPHSKIILSYNRLNETVTNFGILVRAAILKDALYPIFKKKGSYLKISDISDIDGMAYFIKVSTRGWKPWLDPKGREKIRTELRNLVGGMLNARQICSVYEFELEPKEWVVRGWDFVDAVSDWEFSKVRKAVVNRLLHIG